MATTLLVLSGIGVPEYSARGLSQTLEPISQSASLHRTINGQLVDLSVELFQKYSSTIRASDQQPPAVVGVWPGKTVQVWCVSELVVPGTIDVPTEEDTEPSTEALDDLPRPHVPGSIRHESGYTFFRPILTMMVTGFSTDTDEYGAEIGWSMQLEEV